MKFYFVAWYDDFDCCLFPMNGLNFDSVVDIPQNVDLVRLYKTQRGAEKFRDKCRNWDGDDYYVVELDTEALEEV